MEIQLTQKFKQTVLKSVLGILLFVLTYLILFLLALALTIACIVLGFMIIVGKFSMGTLILGGAIAGFGVMIFVFLIKFLFQSSSSSDEIYVEIKQPDYPELFGLIDELAQEIGTKLPKKVILIPDVNAAVFYDSSFMSMFFPTRKNLKIGMGLINTLTQQELKSVLAHEFGHFSQRSMSVGSYVYNVNRIIYNLLYENDSFNSNISGWASLGGVFSIFTFVAVKIIQGIQWILGEMYHVINLSYLELSREMEFHADEVAANVAGSQPMIDALYKLNLAQYSYSSVFRFYEHYRKDNVFSTGVYREQKFILNYTAKIFHLNFRDGQPVVGAKDLNLYNRSKLSLEDPWASHPSNEDRAKALEKLAIVRNNVNNRAGINLLPDFAKQDEYFTRELFPLSVKIKNYSLLSLAEFESMYLVYNARYDFPEDYNKYYNNYRPAVFDTDSIVAIDDSISFNQLFGDAQSEVVLTRNGLDEDLDTLKYLMDAPGKIKSFEYENKKYGIQEAPKLHRELLSQIDKLTKELVVHDRKIYSFFYHKALQQGLEKELKSKYDSLFELDEADRRRQEVHQDHITAINAINAARTDQESINAFGMLHDLESAMKHEVRSFLSDDSKDCVDADLQELLNDYIESSWVFSIDVNPGEAYAERLFTILDNFELLSYSIFYKRFTELLNFQLTLFK